MSSLTLHQIKEIHFTNIEMLSTGSYSVEIIIIQNDNKEFTIVLFSDDEQVFNEYIFNEIFK